MEKVLKLEFFVVKDGEWTGEMQDELVDLLVDFCQDKGYKSTGMSKAIDDEDEMPLTLGKLTEAVGELAEMLAEADKEEECHCGLQNCICSIGSTES